MKIILAICFFFLLLISCTNREKKEVYPRKQINIDTTDNIEDKTIHLRYKDSSTMTTSRINILTKEMHYHSFSRIYFDSVHTTYSKMKIWTVKPPEDKSDSYYYSKSTVITNSTRDSSTKTTNSVNLYSKNEIPYQKRLELLAWPMNQLLSINQIKGSIITGSYIGDSISYQYKLTNYINSWRTATNKDARVILKNTNDTIYMTLESSF